MVAGGATGMIRHVSLAWGAAHTPRPCGDTIPDRRQIQETARDMSTHTTSTPAHRTQTPPPRTMRAVVLTGHGGLDRLSVREDWPLPVPGSNGVLVAVGACGLNNTDVNTRTAWYSAGVSGATTGQALEAAAGADAAWGGSAISFPRIQGADVCGRVVALGSECDPSLLGRRVLIDPWLRDWNDPLDRDKCGYFGSECDGGFAEYTIVDARNVHPVTSELSDAELATFATSYMTAENMLNRAEVQAGDRVLISGASGGVGSALIQLGAAAWGRDHRALRRIEGRGGPGAGRPSRPAALPGGSEGGAAYRHRPRRGDGSHGRGRRSDLAATDLGPGPRRALHLRQRHRRSDRQLRPQDILPAGPRLHGRDGPAAGGVPGPRGLYRARRDSAGPGRDLAFARSRCRVEEAFIAKRHIGNIVVTTTSDS